MTHPACRSGTKIPNIGDRNVVEIYLPWAGLSASGGWYWDLPRAPRWIPQDYSTGVKFLPGLPYGMKLQLVFHWG